MEKGIEIGQELDTKEASCREFVASDAVKAVKLNVMKFICWGVERFIADKTPITKFIQFDVRGLKFKGTVYLFLNGADLYDVYYVKDGKIEDKRTDVYFDELTDVIDERIEYIESYEF